MKGDDFILMKTIKGYFISDEKNALLNNEIRLTSDETKDILKHYIRIGTLSREKINKYTL